MQSKLENMEDIPKEKDTPKDKFPIDSNSQVKPNEVTKDVFNTIKGHNLLGWCVGLFFFIYLVEFFWNKGEMSKIGETTIEILKLLTFSLTGYLFGTHNNMIKSNSSLSKSAL